MKRAISQDDWKRTQLRMPQNEYDRIMQYAERNKVSINTAILTLIDKALSFEDISENIEYGLPTIRAMEYNPLPSLNSLERRVECAKYITQFLQRNHFAKIINIESVDDGVVFWYSNNK